MHAEQLDQFVGEAKALESFSDWQMALQRWNRALELLPPDATQADWVRKQVQRVEFEIRLIPPPETQPEWVDRLGPLAPVGAAIWKSKGLLALFKLSFLLSLAAFTWFSSLLFGPKFGVGLAAQILIHEFGHYIDIRRRGLPADMPVFLPGLGAYVRWRALGVSDETRAAVSLAGPLAGFFAAAACAAVWWKTGDASWASLAHAGAMLNLLNLIPVWALDGGQAMAALGKAERWLLLGICLLLLVSLREWVFLLLAGGVVYRLTTKDIAAEPSRGITAYFVIVLALLGLLLFVLPDSVSA